MIKGSDLVSSLKLYILRDGNVKCFYKHYNFEQIRNYFQWFKKSSLDLLFTEKYNTL
ncbi:hypothetical protein BpHYR1_051794 [Brachionus plicatilis]|uniref:Uncharacterized protein n=1 Tax=Brachionus plicatilis TaxID=10195 RepID=A0A3M7PCU7_BRAPC|nr:hypothetical protein BpHYR1_051794 [Brachionus plicatilis]